MILALIILVLAMCVFKMHIYLSSCLPYAVSVASDDFAIMMNGILASYRGLR